MSYTSLGATVRYSRWVDMWAAQKNEARRLFGSTNVNLPGRTDIQYANLTGDHAKKLMAYWEPQLATVNQRVQDDAFWRNLSPAEYTAMASRDAWNRDYNAYKTMAVFTKAYALAWGSSVMPASMSVPFWQKTEPLILRGGAVMESPTPWDMISEALAERVSKVTDALTPKWWPWVKWGGVAIGGLYVLQMLQSTRRDR